MTADGKTVSPYMYLRRVAKQILPEWLIVRLRSRAGRGRPPTPNANATPSARSQREIDQLIGLEVRLWSTRNAHYADRLAIALQSLSESEGAYARGTIALARWLFYQGRFDEALRRLGSVRFPDPEASLELDLLRVDCLCRLRRAPEALGILSKMVGRRTSDPNLLLRVGYARSLAAQAIGHGSGAMSEALNRIYGNAGFGLIRRTSPASPPSIENISCDVPRAEPRESLPLVSVITRVDEPVSESLAGVSSLVSQSWQRLELLVLIGETERAELASSAPKLVDDKRVALIEWNSQTDRDESMAMAASRATGALITFHDRGSWAHPQRVEVQASALMADPSLEGAISCFVRVNRDLTPRPLGVAASERLVGPDPDTIMLRASGLSSDEISQRAYGVHSLYSPVNGELTPPSGFALAGDGVPLTLSTTRGESPPSSRRAGVL